MSTIVPTSMTRYDLSEMEYRTGTTLNVYQSQVIQNLIADCAEEKINLKFDPNNPVNFAQQEAALTGKLEVLRYILECSEIAIAEAAQLGST